MNRRTRMLEDDESRLIQVETARANVQGTLALALYLLAAMAIIAWWGFQMGQDGLPLQHEGAPATNVTDASRLRAIVTNPVVNAIKYAPSGAVLLSTRRGEDGALAIEVSDNGPGLPQSVLKVLGTPWVRGENARVQEEGFGLGLSIVMSLAQDFGLKMDVQSGRDGTRFTFVLPGDA